MENKSPREIAQELYKAAKALPIFDSSDGGAMWCAVRSTRHEVKVKRLKAAIEDYETVYGTITTHDLTNRPAGV